MKEHLKQLIATLKLQIEAQKAISSILINVLKAMERELNVKKD